MARQRTARTASVNPRERREAHREALNKAQAYMSGEGEARKEFERGMMEKLGAVGYGSQQTMDRLSSLQEEFGRKEAAFRTELTGYKAANENLAKQFWDYRVSQDAAQASRDAQAAQAAAAAEAARQQAQARQQQKKPSAPSSPKPTPSTPKSEPAPSLFRGGGAGVNSGAGRFSREQAASLFSAVYGQKKKK